MTDRNLDKASFRRVIFLGALAIFSSACQQQASTAARVTDDSPLRTTTTTAATTAGQAMPIPKPLNVIFMVGDGMGLSQLSAGMFANGNKIAFERMSVVGLHKPGSSDNLVTDSAAGATAFSCGEKTYNGAIGVKPDGSPCPTILEYAHGLGMPTGLVVTSTIVHATPASFFAHEALRGSYENIAEQLVGAEVDFFIGGGQKFFQQREDGRNLVAEMTGRGRVVESYFDKTLEQLTASAKTTYGYFTADNDPLPADQGRTYLAPASKMALDYLDERDTLAQGFFLMIEGSQIDWGGHANKGDYIVNEVKDFSRTIDVVLDWAAAHGNTLVVITADHETGGFAVNNGSTPEAMIYDFTSDYHTATMVPVFAEGPGAEAFSGIYENTEIYRKLKFAIDGSR